MTARGAGRDPFGRRVRRHETKVTLTPAEKPTWRASCGCGWRGAIRPDFDNANADAQRHVDENYGYGRGRHDV